MAMSFRPISISNLSCIAALMVTVIGTYVLSEVKDYHSFFFII